MNYFQLRGLSFDKQAKIIADEGVCISCVVARTLDIRLYRVGTSYIEVWKDRETAVIDRIVETSYCLIDPCLKHFLKIHQN
ncbi:hypothetical protein [Persicobacter psychrovividus]|uniref:Uncharacterized protein n=1 Tax=Persicobacter psychrovividus TaxID=387638 RepID=A0ABM7VF60_9BACT|nr:hypothetical protein PEPS_19090 [Persicobacter psychrovividus]